MVTGAIHIRGNRRLCTSNPVVSYFLIKRIKSSTISSNPDIAIQPVCNAVKLATAVHLYFHFCHESASALQSKSLDKTSSPFGKWSPAPNTRAFTLRPNPEPQRCSATTADTTSTNMGTFFFFLLRPPYCCTLV